MTVSIYCFVMTLLILGSVITSSSPSDFRDPTTLSDNEQSLLAGIRLVETRKDAARMFQQYPVAIPRTAEVEGGSINSAGSSQMVPPALRQIPRANSSIAIEEPDRQPLELAAVDRASVAASRPSWISIPSLEVEAAIVPVGLTGAGQMDTPEQYSDVGWYQYGAVPGQPGRSVLAGHLDSFHGPAVFYLLNQLQPGDLIRIHSSATNSPVEYLVRDLAYFWTDLAPVEEIFGPTDATELVLITCGGPYDRGSASYLQRLVVYATLSTPEPQELPRPVDQVLPPLQSEDPA